MSEIQILSLNSLVMMLTLDSCNSDPQPTTYQNKEWSIMIFWRDKPFRFTSFFDLCRKITTRQLLLLLLVLRMTQHVPHNPQRYIGHREIPNIFGKSIETPFCNSDPHPTTFLTTKNDPLWCFGRTNLLGLHFTSFFDLFRKIITKQLLLLLLVLRMTQHVPHNPQSYIEINLGIYLGHRETPNIFGKSIGITTS